MGECACGAASDAEEGADLLAQQDGCGSEDGRKEAHRPDAERSGGVRSGTEILRQLVDGLRDRVEFGFLCEDQGIGDFQHGEAECEQRADDQVCRHQRERDLQQRAAVARAGVPRGAFEFLRRLVQSPRDGPQDVRHAPDRVGDREQEDRVRDGVEQRMRPLVADGHAEEPDCHHDARDHERRHGDKVEHPAEPELCAAGQERRQHTRDQGQRRGQKRIFQAVYEARRVTNGDGVYVYAANTSGDEAYSAANWVLVSIPGSAIQSVNGYQGPTIVLDTDDVAEDAAVVTDVVAGNTADVTAGHNRYYTQARVSAYLATLDARADAVFVNSDKIVYDDDEIIFNAGGASGNTFVEP